MNISLENQTVIITGGNGGIGQVAAELFRSAGAKVFVWDIHFSAPYNEGITAIQVDITQPGSVEKALSQVLSQTGRVDVLINNAGITRDASLQKMSFQQWQDVIDVNLSGVFNCTKAVSPIMIQQGYGRIINTSSVVAHNGNYGQTNYVASKSGVIGMTKVWARELGKHGITVNAVAPGFVQTAMIDTVPMKVLEQLHQRTCLPRMGQPIDVAKAYLFLASDLAGFITGHTLNVDGGLVL